LKKIAEEEELKEKERKELIDRKEKKR